MLATVSPLAESTEPVPPPRRRLFPHVAEGAAVALSPLIAFFVLRVQAMAPVVFPDPSMHTILIVDPRDVFMRYSGAYASTERMREAGQAGFLVLARLSYLAFGAVHGFFAMRYFFALVAIVPAYLLLRRLYGIPAGAVAIVVLLSSPVIITAWGTDYPDSAVVSYVVGAIACLAMPWGDRRPTWWLVLAGAFMTMAVWAHGMGALLVAVMLVVYCGVRLLRARHHFLRDVALLAGVGVAITFLLMIGSALLIGPFDFIPLIVKGALYLNRPAQIPWSHSSNRHWALYVSYVLVPPSVIAVFAATFWRRLRSIPTPQLFVGLVCALQFAVFAYLQFLNHIETLEMHYFSSTLWGTVGLALAITIVELCRPLSERPVGRWLPAALVVAIPLGYEAYPHVPAFGWLWYGVALAVVPVVFAGIMRPRTRGRHSDPTARVGLGYGLALAATVVVVAGSLLVLTVAPIPAHPPLAGVALSPDPAPAYAGALGGDASTLIDWYQVSAALPSFVGNATYRNEQLMMWYPPDEIALLVEPTGMYHSYFNSLSNGFPVLAARDADNLRDRRPAELLLLSTTGAQFRNAFQALSRYDPIVLRTTVLSRGPVVLHAWLIVLGSFAQHTVS